MAPATRKKEKLPVPDISPPSSIHSDAQLPAPDISPLSSLHSETAQLPAPDISIPSSLYSKADRALGNIKAADYEHQRTSQKNLNATDRIEAGPARKDMGDSGNLFEKISEQGTPADLEHQRSSQKKPADKIEAGPTRKVLGGLHSRFKKLSERGKPADHEHQIMYQKKASDKIEAEAGPARKVLGGLRLRSLFKKKSERDRSPTDSSQVAKGREAKGKEKEACRDSTDIPNFHFKMDPKLSKLNKDELFMNTPGDKTPSQAKITSERKGQDRDRDNRRDQYEVHIRGNDGIIYPLPDTLTPAKDNLEGLRPTMDDGNIRIMKMTPGPRDGQNML